MSIDAYWSNVASVDPGLGAAATDGSHAGCLESIDTRSDTAHRVGDRSAVFVAHIKIKSDRIRKAHNDKDRRENVRACVRVCASGCIVYLVCCMYEGCIGTGQARTCKVPPPLPQWLLLLIGDGHLAWR